MTSSTLILSGIGLLLAAIPVRFAMDMAGDLYNELLKDKWVKWIRHFKKNTDPVTALTTLKTYIKKDLDKIKENENESEKNQIINKKTQWYDKYKAKKLVKYMIGFLIFGLIIVITGYMVK